MGTVLRTPEFDRWLINLRDLVGRAKILARIRRAELDNFGDVKALGDGVSEMRIDVGPGYSVYYARGNRVVYLLLCGAVKSSQAQDIKRAQNL